MNRIAAIIVTYNRKNKLRRCLDAVFAQSSDEKPDVIIVDNGSDDGTEEMVQGIINNEDNVNEHGKIIYEKLHCNSGGAGGFHYGMKLAVLEGYDNLWLMDDDCIPADAALGELLRYSDKLRGEYGFLSSKVLWTDGLPCKMNVPRKTMYRNVKSWEAEAQTVAMASFVSLFVPTHVVKEVGLPIKEFFIWTEDWEYTRRISRKYPCYLITDSVVVHDMDTDINAKADISISEEDRLDRFRYLYRNDVYLYRREGIRGICYEAVRLPYHLLKIAISKNTFGGRVKRAGILVRGTLDGIRFHPAQEHITSDEYAK